MLSGYERWVVTRGLHLLYRLTGPVLLLGLLTTSCSGSLLPRSDAQTPPRGPSEENQSVAVEATAASTGSVDAVLEYTGTTQPAQQVALRAQVEGQIVSLGVDVGDSVTQGAELGRLNSRLLSVEVNEAQAELEARRSEVAEAEAAVSNAQTEVERARVDLRQAQADRDRLQRLAAAGAISEQEAEQAQMTWETAQQALQAAEAQVRSQQQSVRSAQGRVQSQQAVVAQTQERLSYATLNSPLTGRVLNRLVEPGDFVQSGQEVLNLGDLSTLKVSVQFSELELSQIRVGQTVQVQLDAFPNEPVRGQVSRIAPAADAASRLVPVEVTIPNPDGRFGSGLLARVRFADPSMTRVVVPESALELTGDDTNPTLFIVDRTETGATVLARPVQLGDRANGLVEVLSGLTPGEVFVVSSAQPLQDGQTVRLSILSDVDG